MKIKSTYSVSNVFTKDKIYNVTKEEPDYYWFVGDHGDLCSIYKPACNGSYAIILPNIPDKLNKNTKVI